MARTLQLIEPKGFQEIHSNYTSSGSKSCPMIFLTYCDAVMVLSAQKGTELSLAEHTD
jgi:hypothetical protein